MRRLSVLPTVRGLPGDILRGMIVAVAIEVLRHYLRPKDNAITAVDKAITVLHGEQP